MLATASIISQPYILCDITSNKKDTLLLKSLSISVFFGVGIHTIRVIRICQHLFIPLTKTISTRPQDFMRYSLEALMEISIFANHPLDQITGMNNRRMIPPAKSVSDGLE